MVEVEVEVVVRVDVVVRVEVVVGVEVGVDNNSNSNQARKTNTMTSKKEIGEARAVVTDKELAEGVFEIGAQYHVRTPTYQYVGHLDAVTETVFVLSKSATVYNTGNYENFYGKGTAEDIQWHNGTKRLIVDRGGTVLHQLGKEIKP